MAKACRAGGGQRAVNAIFRWLARRGKGAPYLHVLTMTGRASGLQRSVPVDVMEIDGERYLVAPYGPVNWVQNLRADSTATLTRGADLRVYEAVELAPAQSVDAIREYVRTVPITKNYWHVNVDSTDEDVVADAQHHPVFRLRPPKR